MADNPDESVSFAKAAALSPESGYLYFRKTTESGVSEIHSIETLRTALGVGTDSNYVHNQQVASTSWVINHNLNKGVAVTVVDTAGNQVMGDMIINDMNTVTINFSAGFSGKAYIN